MVCPWWFVSSKTADFRSRSALKHGLGNNASLFSSTVYVCMYAYVSFVVVDNQLKVTYRHLDWICQKSTTGVNKQFVAVFWLFSLDTLLKSVIHC